MFVYWFDFKSKFSNFQRYPTDGTGDISASFLCSRRCVGLFRQQRVTTIATIRRLKGE